MRSGRLLPISDNAPLKLCAVTYEITSLPAFLVSAGDSLCAFSVTGAAGFIGSHMVDRLLAAGHSVIGFDNFSTGQRRFLHNALANPRFVLQEADLLDRAALSAAMHGIDLVVHLAANADVRFGTQHPRKDLDQNTIATWNVLETMREQGCMRIVFSSTGSIYGEPEIFPTPETCPFPIQTSLYGASKLAAEGLIQAYCEGFRIAGLHFSLRFDSWGTLFAWSCLRFLSPAFGAPRSSPCAGQWSSEKILFVRARLYRRDSHRTRSSRRKSEYLQSRHR